METMFANRSEAGRRLADALAGFRGTRAVVLALPRGGVILGGEIAAALGLRLDLAIAKKLGHPLNPEAAVGAVSEDGERALMPGVLREVDAEWLDDITRQKRAEAQSLRRELSGQEAPSRLDGQTAVLVDDGVATGHTMEAAILSARKRGASHVVVAVPVAPVSFAEELRKRGIESVVLETPDPLFAVGMHYEDFRQTTDQEVKEILSRTERAA